MAGFSVKKPLTIFVTVLGIIVLGVVAYLKMTPDLLPNMDFPYVIIVTSDPGASPESIEQSITRPVEQSMATLDKIKTVTSTSQDSVSMVTLEFEDGANMDTISVDIQQKISVLQGSWDAAGDCLGATLYDLLRRLYRQSGGNEDLFATEAVDFDAGAVDAALLRSRGAYMRALTEADELPHLNSDALTTLPGIGQSAAQVIHNVDERAGK